MSDERDFEMRLLRQLQGESTAADDRQIERLEAAGEKWRQRADRLRATWRFLLPPPSSPAPDLVPALVALARRGHGEDLYWSLAPAWARTAAAAALVAGLAMGLGLGVSVPEAPAFDRGGEAAIGDDPALEGWQLEASWADAYWLALEQSGGRLGTDEIDPEPAP